MTTIWWCGQFVVYKLAEGVLPQHLLHEEDPPEEDGEQDQNSGGKVTELEAQSKSDEEMIGRLMADILDKQNNMENLHSDLQHSLRMIQEMQNAINRGQDERNALRFRITQMEVNRQDIVVAKTVQCWHVNPQCQFLQGAGAIKVLKACAGCT